jgi:hypothetical protein
MMTCFVIVQYIWASKLHYKYKNISNYHLVQFENVLSDPEGVIKRLCEFIEIDFMPEMLRLNKGQHDHQPSSLTGKKERNFDTAAAYRWQQVITSFEKSMITTLTKGSMKRFAYNPQNQLTPSKNL